MQSEACFAALPGNAPSPPSGGAPFPVASLEESVLLARLAEEFISKLREGSLPSVEEYALRFPGISTQIRKLFPTLIALEDVAKQSEPPGNAADANGLPGDSPSYPGALAWGRFVAGTVICGRYRIVALLGKGAMGEVYRAEDLKLAQSVALKFLPESVALDGGVLAGFHREVHLARQVAHPNVCRVFDIDEVRGEHFLSMEYIDGEDLSSLLRRIGRLPIEKAADVARQLSSGLAAAHESGVLHRDLKPANIMIDGRGKVKIADFGLAVLADRPGDCPPAGTPSYMAPEQLSQKECTAKSDIYALGLVLYEIFTGKKVFRADSVVELMRLHEQTPPVRPSRLVRDMDPKVEYWIMRCLGESPLSRPTAVEIAGVLSEGSVVATELAAGETRPPEIVAAARGEPVRSRAIGTACMLAFAVSLLLMVFLAARGLLHRAVPLDVSPEVLADRARTLIRHLGYSEQPVDIAFGFGLYDDDLKHFRANDRSVDRRKKLKAGSPAVRYFWYRQSPSSLIPTEKGRVAADDRPPVAPMMIRVFLDTNGNLVEFQAFALEPKTR